MCKHMLEEDAGRCIALASLARLQPEQCFFRGTCPRKKQTSFISTVCGRRNSARLFPTHAQEYSYAQNRWLPMTLMSGRDQIQALVAVSGLK